MRQLLGASTVGRRVFVRELPNYLEVHGVVFK